MAIGVRLALLCGLFAHSPGIAVTSQFGHVGDVIAVEEIASPVTTQQWIGAVSIDSSRAFRTTDRRVRNFTAVSAPLIAMAETAEGCLIGFGKPRGEELRVTIAANPYAHPFSDFRPTQVPGLPSVEGYKFVAAVPAKSRQFEWLGLWAARTNEPVTRVIGFGRKDGRSDCHVLAEFPVRFALLQSFPGLHGWGHFTAITQAETGEPIVWIQASYPPPRVGARGPHQPC